MNLSSCIPLIHNLRIHFRFVRNFLDTIILRTKTPDPIPNSEVKFLRPSVVLSLEGKVGVVLDFRVTYALNPSLDSRLGTPKKGDSVYSFFAPAKIAYVTLYSLYEKNKTTVNFVCHIQRIQCPNAG